MKFLAEGPTRLLPPPPSSSSPRPRGFDLESTELWDDPDGSTQGVDPVECVRTAMLRHQHVFRAQLFELHRLYWTQKSLMNGFSYDHQVANHNGAAFDWASDHMAMTSVAGNAKATQGRSSISSQTPLEFVPGCYLDGPPPPHYSQGFNSKLPQQEWLTASEFQLFHDCHTRAPESRYFQLQQPLNHSAAWGAVSVKSEPVELTLTTANASNNHNIDKTTFWGRFSTSNKGREPLIEPKEVINLDSSSASDSEEVNRKESEPARPPPSCFTPPPICSIEVSRQACRLPKPFDMNYMCEEERVDHYGTGHSINMQPGINGTNNCKPEKTVLFDLNTVQYEDSSAIIQEAENNVSSSSAGSSVVVHGVANDGCASVANFHLGFSKKRTGECSVKIEVDTLNSDFKNIESKRAKILSNESDNAQSSRFAGSSVWNYDRTDTNPVVLHAPSSKFLLELNSLPDDTISDDTDERLVPSSNGSSSASQPKLHCSSSKYPPSLAKSASDSRVTSTVTDCLLGGCHQPSLGSTNLPSAVGRDVGSVAKRVEGERSEEDTVSSRMHKICSSFPDGCPNSSLEQKQGGVLEACASRNEPQGNVKLIDLFTTSEGDTLISDIDGQARQQQQLMAAVNNSQSSHSAVAQRAVAGVGEFVSPENDNPRSCYSGLLHDDGDGNADSKHRDLEPDLVILTAAETLAQIFNNRGTTSCTDAAARQEVGEEMDCDAQPECSYDSLELIVLALPESQEDECSSPPNNSDHLSVGTATTTEKSSSGLRFNTRRGRQLRDFQKDILPGIISLSRHEICEDMHAFTEIVKFEELKRKGGRSGRGTRGSRGSVVRKKRSRTSAYVQRR